MQESVSDETSDDQWGDRCIDKMQNTQSRWKDPPYPLRSGGGAHVCSGASCYVWEKFSKCVHMYDGLLFCKVTTTKKVARKLRANYCSSDGGLI